MSILLCTTGYKPHSKMDLFRISPISGRRLTLKQYLFVHNYIINGYNATRAAVDSGYKADKYNSPKHIGYENLTKLHLRESISALLTEQGVTRAYVVKTLSVAVKSGIGKKPANSDTLRGLEMVFMLHGKV